jgi:hypothetical protein
MKINNWLKSFWNVVTYPFKALNHFLFENDEHHIVSERGYEALREKDEKDLIFSFLGKPVRSLWKYMEKNGWEYKDSFNDYVYRWHHRKSNCDVFCKVCFRDETGGVEEVALLRISYEVYLED